MNIQELKAHFDKCDYPEQLELSDGIFIKNSDIFVKSHIEYLESNPSNGLFLPYYNRLLLFYQKTTSERIPKQN